MNKFNRKTILHSKNAEIFPFAKSKPKKKLLNILLCKVNRKMSCCGSRTGFRETEKAGPFSRNPFFLMILFFAMLKQMLRILCKNFAALQVGHCYF